jgi:hypothetical protein
MTEYATVNTKKEFFNSIKTIWKMSGIVNAHESPIYKIINRTEILLRSLQMIRLIRKQDRINATLSKHAAILEVMNCTITTGPEYSYPQHHDCRCSCAYEEAEETFFKSTRSSENN